MITPIAIALGGAVGALLRFWVANGVYAWLGRDFPYGTLTVNVLGSFALGFLAIFMVERLSIDAAWRAAILVGGLGAFTTFSTFSLETIALVERGHSGLAILNIVGSCGLCLLSTALGMLLARQI